MIVMIDNYDSFTYNLVQYFGQLGKEVRTFRNDALSLPALARLDPEAIVLSPGPKTPREAGICVALIRHFQGSIPLLGVCLGHQAIGVAFGGKITRAQTIMHGKTSEILHDGKGVFRGITSPFSAARYHSLVLERESLPDCLEVSAFTPDGEIMGVRHRTCCIEGMQFHPESILTLGGKRLLRNFLSLFSPKEHVA